MDVRVLNDLAVYGGISFLKQVTEFPDTPQLGQFVLKDNNLYGYLTVAGMDAWYPFGQRTVYYVHTQAMPSLTWVVNHGLGTTEVFVQVKDQNGNIINVGKTDVDENTFHLNFTSAVTGTVLVVATATINVPRINASQLNIAGVVTADSAGLRVNGEFVLTTATISAEIAAAVQAEADARIAADGLKANAADVYTKTQVYTRQEVDAAIAAAIAAYDANKYV
jgi:hypothetical protein